MNSPETIRNCLLCGANDFRRVFDESHFLVRCRNCGMVSSGKLPTLSELKEYYDDYPSYESIPEITSLRYNELLDRLEKYRQTNNILETGCGYGFFLDEARKRKWNVYGTEVSQNAVIECRKKNIHVSETLDGIRTENNKPFDVIVSMEVIEHLTDPTKEVAAYYERLRPDGALYVTTPNFNSLSRHLFGKRWNVIMYPEHLTYFTGSTYGKLMKKNKFSKVFNHSSGFSTGRLIYSWRSLNTDESELKGYDYNRTDRDVRDRMESNFLLRMLKIGINSVLSLFNSGDTLKVLYQKK